MKFRLFSGGKPKGLAETTITPINAESLVLLESVYDHYVRREWLYSREFDLPRFFILDHCIGDFAAFQTQLAVVCWGLAERLSGADKAYRLFERLYYQGFQDGYCKERIRRHFERIFPRDVLAKLDTHAITMSDVMASGLLDDPAVSDKGSLSSSTRW